jgi:hypothetical protein
MPSFFLNALGFRSATTSASGNGNPKTCHSTSGAIALAARAKRIDRRLSGLSIEPADLPIAREWPLRPSSYHRARSAMLPAPV